MQHADDNSAPLQHPKVLRTLDTWSGFRSSSFADLPVGSRGAGSIPGYQAIAAGTINKKSTLYSSEGLMLKLKFQYFGHLMQRADSLEETLMLGKAEGKKRWGRQRMRWFDSITDSVEVNLSKLRDSEGERSRWAAVRGVTESWTRLSD